MAGSQSKSKDRVPAWVGWPLSLSFIVGVLASATFAAVSVWEEDFLMKASGSVAAFSSVIFLASFVLGLLTVSSSSKEAPND